MGVKDFISFVQKFCPGVIKELPNRLLDLKGKTIVIDGTLITQRLHFARIPYANRHVLGWHRLIMDMREAGVNAICVFDSKGRPLAKMREIERRRARRKLEEARGVMEMERLARLRRFRALSPRFHALSQSERAHVAAQIKASTIPQPYPRDPVPFGAPIVEPEVEHDGRQNESLPSREPRQISLASCSHHHDSDQVSEYRSPPTSSESFTASAQHPTVPTDDLLPPLSDAGLIPTANDRSITACSEFSTDYNASSHTEATLTPQSSQLQRDGVSLDRSQPLTRESGQAEAICCDLSDRHLSAHPDEGSKKYGKSDSLTVASLPDCGASDSETSPLFIGSKPAGSVSSSGDDIASQLTELHCNFTATKPQFTPLKSVFPATSSVLDTVADIEKTYTMSKEQYALVMEEDAVWNEILNIHTKSDILEREVSLQLELKHLEAKSQEIYDMFQRRRPPANATYDDCKLILQAMGVPWLESPAHVEGEAFAAALVHHGHADYVASEDTDVIVYEAPLIRNLASKKGPLTQVNSARVRQILKLARSSYVDLALLCGTDFSQRIKNVGPVTALKLIKKHHTIENMLEDPQFAAKLPSENYMHEIIQARLIFGTLPPSPDKGLFKPGIFDESLVRTLLDHFGLSRAASIPWDFATAFEGTFEDVAPPGFTEPAIFGDELSLEKPRASYVEQVLHEPDYKPHDSDFNN